MSKVLTLRGTFINPDNARITDQQIFTYEGVDLTRGWEVEKAYIWCTSQRGANVSDGQMQCAASIATDTIGSVGFDAICDSNDNRQIGWCTWGYQTRSGSGASDFIAHSGNPSGPVPFVLDPEHVVTQALYLNHYSTTEDTDATSREWSYLVVLRPKKLDPARAILYRIKNVAQDVSN